MFPLTCLPKLTFQRTFGINYRKVNVNTVYKNVYVAILVVTEFLQTMRCDAIRRQHVCCIEIMRYSMMTLLGLQSIQYVT